MIIIMTVEAIKNKVIELISELFKSKGFNSDIIEHKNLIDDFGMDSITFITLIVDIESAFDITIPDDLLNMNHFMKVDNVIRIVSKQLDNKTKITEDICDDQT